VVGEEDRMRVPLWFIIDLLKGILKVLMYLIVVILSIIWWIIEEFRKDVKKALLIPIALLIIASVYLNSSSIKEYFTPAPQPTLGLPVSKYEGDLVSMMYPAGWGEIEEEPGWLSIREPSGCAFISIFWEKSNFDTGQSAEDRYKAAREAAYSIILEAWGNKPEFEILHEYRLGDAPIFEYQYWQEEYACMENVRVMVHVDPETGQYEIANWQVWDYCGTDKWHQEMGLRDALFDAVMQSITFK